MWPRTAVKWVGAPGRQQEARLVKNFKQSTDAVVQLAAIRQYAGTRNEEKRKRKQTGRKEKRTPRAKRVCENGNSHRRAREHKSAEMQNRTRTGLSVRWAAGGRANKPKLG